MRHITAKRTEESNLNAQHNELKVKEMSLNRGQSLCNTNDDNDNNNNDDEAASSKATTSSDRGNGS